MREFLAGVATSSGIGFFKVFQWRFTEPHDGHSLKTLVVLRESSLFYLSEN